MLKSPTMDAGRGLFTALLLAISGAVVAGIFGVYTTLQNGKLEKDKIDAQAKIAEVQSQLEKEKLEAQKERVYSDSLRAHFEKVAALQRELNGQYWEIRLANQCIETLTVALNYQALDGRWISEGWFAIPAETESPVAYTANSVVYYVASTPHKAWKGQNENENTMWANPSEPFKILIGEWSPGPAQRVPALIHNIDRSAFGPSVISFKCER
jgi:hypothetical protein